MRDYKFRLINKGQIVGFERHILVSPAITPNDNYRVKIQHSRDGEYWLDIEKMYIMHDDKEQYINRKDIKGIEIYEGDTCKNGDYNSDTNAYIYRVEDIEWDNDNACWQGWNFNKDGMSYEKIGNIHENTENLEQSK